MYLTDIALDDFRSYHSQVVHLQPGVCLLVGANGQGKTNFVEAISYLTNFHSHRAAVDTALVRYQPQNAGLADYQSVDNQDLAGDSEIPASYPVTAVEAAPNCAVIRVKAQINGRSTMIDLEILAGRANRARLARNLVKPKEIKGLVRSVLFAPEDLQILKGDPALRRRFLDDLLVIVEPIQSAALSAHQKLLRQRGALLKEAQKRHRRGQNWDDLKPTLTIFNEQLASQAAQIIAGRQRIVTALKPLAQAAYQLVLGAEHRANSASELGLEYLSAGDSDVTTGPDLTTESGQPQVEELNKEKEIYRRLLAEIEDKEAQEIARGVNLVGAHRDDLLVTLDALPVKGFASQGETWTAALALRLAQFELFSQIGETPILLLDDVFSELDQSRRAALVSYMNKADQVIVTAAVEQDIPSSLNARVYQVQRTAQGTVITGPVEHD